MPSSFFSSGLRWEHGSPGVERSHVLSLTQKHGQQPRPALLTRSSGQWMGVPSTSTAPTTTTSSNPTESEWSTPVTAFQAGVLLSLTLLVCGVWVIVGKLWTSGKFGG